MSDHLRDVASPLAYLKSTLNKQLSHSVNEQFGFLWVNMGLQAVVHVESCVNRVIDVFVGITVLPYVALKGKGSTAGTTRCPKGQDSPLIYIWRPLFHSLSIRTAAGGSLQRAGGSGETWLLYLRSLLQDTGGNAGGHPAV